MLGYLYIMDWVEAMTQHIELRFSSNNVVKKLRTAMSYSFQEMVYRDITTSAI